MEMRSCATALLVVCALFNPAALAAAGESKAPVKKEQPATDSVFSSLGDIASQVGRIEKRLASIDESLKHMEGMEKSLEPVAALARPEGLAALVNQASDAAYARGVSLIIAASICAAILLVLLAFLLRWSLRPQLSASK